MNCTLKWQSYTVLRCCLVDKHIKHFLAPTFTLSRFSVLYNCKLNSWTSKTNVISSCRTMTKCNKTLVAGLMLTHMQSAGTSDWWSMEAWHSIYSLIQLALLCSVTVLNDCLNNSAEEGKYSNRYQVPCLPTPLVQSGVVTELNVDQKNHFFISCRIIVKH